MGMIAAHGLYTYELDMFGPGARSTSALIFIFLPFYQWLAVAVLALFEWVARRLFLVLSR